MRFVRLVVADSEVVINLDNVTHIHPAREIEGGQQCCSVFMVNGEAINNVLLTLDDFLEAIHLDDEKPETNSKIPTPTLKKIAIDAGLVVEETV